MKRYILIFLTAIITFSFATGQQIITTIAGGAPVNNVSATSFGMAMYGTAADKHGNIYVSDYSNSVIRKVNLSTGIATIAAGTQNFGYSGDGGQATAASFYSPEEVALDTAGNLYIFDYTRIRKVNFSTGIISTVAGNGTQGNSGDGGPATSAEIEDYNNEAIAFDKNNNMYITDSHNNTVREVNAATGIINTIAGTGIGGYNSDNIAATAAKLNYPIGVCTDDTGNIYIADEGNYRVRKVRVSTGIISTVAGTGSFGYTGDGGPATAAEISPNSVEVDTSGNIYVSDANNSVVREITISTGIINTVAGNGSFGYTGDGGPATSAEINPSSIALDSLNNLYILDGNTAYGGNRWIREVDATTQNISTIAGNGGGDYDGDGIAATSAQLFFPGGLKTDAAGNVYVADWGNNRIREINTSGVISTFAGNGSPGVTDNLLAINAELSYPNDLVFDTSGNMFIADWNGDRIRKIDTHDTITDFAGSGNLSYIGDGGPATSAGLWMPSGVAVDDSGNVYIADADHSAIREVNWKTNIITTVAGTGVPGYDGDGVAATATELNYPNEVAVDDSGNIYIADTYNNRIRKVSRLTGNINTIAGTGISGYSGDGSAATAAELNQPAGVALDANGIIYISDENNNRIRTVNPSTGIINTIAGNGVQGFSGDGGPATSAELNEPQNVTFDASGNMYVADSYNNRIRKITHVVNLGVNKITGANAGVEIYPNPNNGIFTVALSSHAEPVSVSQTIEVYNVLGEKVYSQITVNSSSYVVNLSNQPDGIYIYRILNTDGSLMGEGKLEIEK